jgi:dUTP pyrophosphatase
MDKVNIYIETLNDDIQIPEYAKLGDAGMDIRSAEDILIDIGETKVIPTGVKVAIPEGYEIQVRPRSGLSLNTPLRIANAPGTIDAGYRNEIGVIITNISQRYDKYEPYVYAHTLDKKGNLQGKYLIKKGDRIAQIVLKEVPIINWIKVDSVKDIGIDRNGGFGSSGVK